MKGIILAGGRATRLFPTTRVISKHLIPVYNKPMIYYPLSVLMLAGIKDILLISRSDDQQKFKELFGNGESLGLQMSYAIQDEPKGIAEAFIIGKDFISDDGVCLILGDNIFFGHQLSQYLHEATSTNQGATIFAYNVSDPERYGVVTFDQQQRAIAIEEKPKLPRSNWAVTGLYFYDRQVVEIAQSLKPSQRGEIEISDVNQAYCDRQLLSVKTLGRGFAWLDTGTYDSLVEASMFIKTIEDRQGMKVGCIEEIAFRKGFINKEQLLRLADNNLTGYGDYLHEVANGG